MTELENRGVEKGIQGFDGGAICGADEADPVMGQERRVNDYLHAACWPSRRSLWTIGGRAWGIRRMGWLSEEADASLLAGRGETCFFPCLILDNDPRQSGPRKRRATSCSRRRWASARSRLGYALCFLAAPLFGVREARQRRTFAFTAGIYNYGYNRGLPLVQKLFDHTDQRTEARCFSFTTSGRGDGAVDAGHHASSAELRRGMCGGHIFNRRPVVTILLADGAAFCGWKKRGCRGLSRLEGGASHGPRRRFRWVADF